MTLNTAPIEQAATTWSTWKLVWSDEFDYEGAPDPSKWQYEEGFVRNRELQYYTNDRRQNARVVDGCLVIEAHQEAFENPSFDAGSDDWKLARRAAEYTSASISTYGLADWTYGRFEVRAKFPAGSGMWPAVWMLGSDFFSPGGGWPECGEIDIVEFVGSEPDVIHGTVHFADDGQHRSIGKKHRLDQATDAFHTYAVEWDADGMTFFCDGEPYHSVATAACDPQRRGHFARPHFLILNLALGGDWAGSVDATQLPQRLLVDYVRVYQR